MVKFAKYGTKEVKVKSGELMATDNVLFILFIYLFIFNIFSKQNRVINLSIRNKMERGTI